MHSQLDYREPEGIIQMDKKNPQQNECGSKGMLESRCVNGGEAVEVKL